jgi:Spy/CpxP family protein refolding chaperone
LALALALLIATPVMAQPPAGKGGGRGMGGFGAGGRGIGARTLDRLNLSTEQREKADAAIAKHAEKIKDLTEKSRLSQEDRTKLMEAVQKIDREGKTPEEMAKLFQAEMKKVQTPEQAKASAELAAERKAELADVKKAIGEEKAKELDKLLAAPMGRGGQGAKAGERPKRQRGEGKKKEA